MKKNNENLSPLETNNKNARELLRLQKILVAAGFVSLIATFIFHSMQKHSIFTYFFGLIGILFFVGNNIISRKTTAILAKSKEIVKEAEEYVKAFEAEGSKRTSMIAELENFTDKRIEEKQMIDAVRAVKNFLIRIGEKSRYPEIEWSALVDIEKVSSYMTYTDNGQEHYVLFAELTDNHTVDYQAHAQLLFIINDINILKMLSESHSPITEQIHDYQTRIILNACYLEHYMDAVEKHITMDKSIISKEIVQAIYDETKNAYYRHLIRLRQENAYLDKQIERKINSEEFRIIPVLPIAIGIIKNNHTKQINHLYMTDEMYEQALKWMASMQAQTMQYR